MRKRFAILLVIGAIAGSVPAQTRNPGFTQYGNQGGLVMGGVGYSKIGDENYYFIHLRPEFAFGKIGIGLNLDLRYNTDTGDLRSEDWDTTYDYFRIIRYLRYGHKQVDPFYARVGTLDAARLGHGFIMNFYSNETLYDQRKIGLALDVDLGKIGFESVTSNLGNAEIIGVRGYYRPLLDVIQVPILENLALGATFVRDFDPDTWSKTDHGVSVYGFDVELPILRTQILSSMLYFDWAQIHGYSAIENETRSFGSGQAVGINLDFGMVLGLVDLAAKLERRWLGKEFDAAFFNPFYELDRYRIVDGDPFYKADQLLAFNESVKGVFGELYGGLLGDTVRLRGMFSRLDDRPKSGELHLAAEAIDAFPTIAAHATYDKVGIETVGDVFSLDDRSFARLGVGYKIQPYLILFMDYVWTFEETAPGSKEYVTQERVEPRLVFAYRF
ncbi:hypothetical protein GF406_24920 [candidate division KSB1 bacterium]|nr:hypothetical protein [candidate division KSB1 bacterium]